MVLVGRLTEEDLPHLMNVLEPVASKWDSICLQLGVPQSTLSNIQAKPTLLAGAPQTFLRSGLYEWMRSGAETCTVSSLANALRTPSVNEVFLANEIEDTLRV